MNKTSILFLGFGALLLAGLFYLLKPAQTPAPAAQVQATAPGPEAKAAEPQPQVFELVVQKGAKRSGPDVMRVTEGDQVILKIVSDHADELHVHGYDLHAAIKAGTPAVLNFKASRSGRFTLELHHSNIELGALEVQPR